MGLKSCRASGPVSYIHHFKAVRPLVSGISFPPARMAPHSSVSPGTWRLPDMKCPDLPLPRATTWALDIYPGLQNFQRNRRPRRHSSAAITANPLTRSAAAVHGDAMDCGYPMRTGPTATIQRPKYHQKLWTMVTSPLKTPLAGSLHSSWLLEHGICRVVQRPGSLVTPDTSLPRQHLC